MISLTLSLERSLSMLVSLFEAKKYVTVSIRSKFWQLKIKTANITITYTDGFRMLKVEFLYYTRPTYKKVGLRYE